MCSIISELAVKTAPLSSSKWMELENIWTAFVFISVFLVKEKDPLSLQGANVIKT